MIPSQHMLYSVILRLHFSLSLLPAPILCRRRRRELWMSASGRNFAKRWHLTQLSARSTIFNLQVGTPPFAASTESATSITGTIITATTIHPQTQRETWPTTSPPSSAPNRTKSTAASTTKSAPAATATAARANTSNPPTPRPSCFPTSTKTRHTTTNRA